MFGRLWAWVRGLSDVATLIQLAGSVGGATVLAILIPAVLQAVLGLPVALRVALGIGIFFVALAVILAVLKAVLERGASNAAGDAPVPPPRDSASEAPSKPYPPIRDDELHKKLFEKRTVYIADFARKFVEMDLVDNIDLLSNALVIRGRTFEDCRIHGPAVLVEGYTPEKTDLFAGSNFWKGNAFWDAPEGEHHTGVIVLKNCTFRDCRFTNVGFLPPSGGFAETQRKRRERRERSKESSTDQQ